MLISWEEGKTLKIRDILLNQLIRVDGKCSICLKVFLHKQGVEEQLLLIHEVFPFQLCFPQMLLRGYSLITAEVNFSRSDITFLTVWPSGGSWVHYSRGVDHFPHSGSPQLFLASAKPNAPTVERAWQYSGSSLPRCTIWQRQHVLDDYKYNLSPFIRPVDGECGTLSSQHSAVWNRVNTTWFGLTVSDIPKQKVKRRRG